VFEWGKNFSSKFDLTPYNQVLDLGCRQGHLSALLAQSYPQHQFTAVDNLCSEIEQAQQQSETNLRYAVNDALLLPYSNEFDAVTSFNCLMWIENKLKAVQNIYQSLKPGGRAFLQFFAYHGRPKNDRFIFYTADLPQWQSYFKGFKSDYYEIALADFCQMLHQVGFILHQVEFCCYPITFSNQDSLSQWMKSWASHSKHLPLRKQDHFFQASTEAYRRFHQHPSHENFVYHEYLLEIICEKPENPHFQMAEKTYQYNAILFTKREAQIVKYYLKGQSAKEIGLVLDISAKTIEFHLAKIKEKCHCHKRSELVQAALKYGFISLLFDNTL
jgi:SAM-dependent methyltransferase